MARAPGDKDRKGQGGAEKANEGAEKVKEMVKGLGVVTWEFR
jgi:hypothetical protein